MTSTSDKRKTNIALEKFKRFERPLLSEPGFQELKSSFRDHSLPKDVSKPPKRKRTSSPGRKGPHEQAAPLRLHLPEAVAAGLRAHEYVGIHNESPWNRFQKVYELKFEDFTAVAMRKASLCEVVMIAASPPYPTELQLAAILGQRTRNIAARSNSSHDDHQDLRAVGRIAMELMQKYVKDDDAVGVEDLNRWPSSSKAVVFLSETTSAVSVNELIN
ncbi:MAG: hypothetical protein M1836_005838 [Candelina mexicana]|nr:MAG: hypothetical protein M1836_005838 [Candelina mexicana]